MELGIQVNGSLGHQVNNINEVGWRVGVSDLHIVWPNFWVLTRAFMQSTQVKKEQEEEKEEKKHIE